MGETVPAREPLPTGRPRGHGCRPGVAATEHGVSSPDHVTLLRLVDRPLEHGELATAAALLGANASPTSLAALALPAGALPDAELVIAGELVVWRGAVLRLDEAHLPASVAAWAGSVWQPHDRAAVPEGPLWRWVRPVRSGAGVVVWGPQALWGGAAVRCGADVPAEVVFDVLRRWWAGEEVAPPSIVEGPDGTMVFVDGDADLWKIGLPGTVAAPDTPDDSAVAAFVEAAAGECGAHSWTITRPARRYARWVAHLDLGGGWRATFDVVAHAGTLTAGRRANLPAPPERTELPEGWEAVGVAGDVVCACSATGLWAVLTRTR